MRMKYAWCKSCRRVWRFQLDVMIPNHLPAALMIDTPWRSFYLEVYR